MIKRVIIMTWNLNLMRWAARPSLPNSPTRLMIEKLAKAQQVESGVRKVEYIFSGALPRPLMEDLCSGLHITGSFPTEGGGPRTNCWGESMEPRHPVSG
jgi:hypothetical protein